MDKATRRAPAPNLRQRWRDAVRDSSDPGIDAQALAVAMALDRWMSADGQTHTSTRRLAEVARVSKNTVTDRLRRLEAAGLLAIDTAGRGRSSRYQATITDPNCPTLWDTLDPVDNPEVSQPVGHPPDRSVPPRGTEVSHPVTKLSHPMGQTPYDPVDMTPKRESAREPRTNGQHPPPPPNPHPLLNRQEITPSVLAEGFAYHLTTRGRAHPHDITDTIDALVTDLAPRYSGPHTAMVELAARLDNLPDHHRRTWPRELANDLNPPPQPNPGPWA